MMGGAINLGEGVVLRPATQADFDFINARLREMDERETEVFGHKDARADLEAAWVILDGDVVVGYVGYLPLADGSILSRSRFLAELTTDAVWSRKVKYVRYSRRVLKAVVAKMPPWVETLYTLPMKDYAGAVAWLERVLKMTRVGEVEVNGIPHVLFRITRKEVLE